MNNVNVKSLGIKALIRNFCFWIAFFKGSWLTWQIDKVYINKEIQSLSFDFYSVSATVYVYFNCPPLLHFLIALQYCWHRSLSSYVS